MKNCPKSPIRLRSGSRFPSRSPIGAILLIIFFIVFPQKAFSESNVAVLISRNIIPYVEAAEGLSSVIAEFERVNTEIFAYEDFTGKRKSFLVDKLAGESFDLYVAVGPEASRFLYGNFSEANASILYSMVLNPQEIFEPIENMCGVSLEIPVEMQLAQISYSTPEIKKLGLVYDPANNQEFFDEAEKAALLFDIEIIPLKVSERRNIPAALKSGYGFIDGFWLIPDRTVISESIIQYIIKEALLRKIPTIGFNKFFYESGAVLAFVFDYRNLGRQAGEMALNILAGNSCGRRPPFFETWVNKRVADKLGIEVVSGQDAGAGD